MKKISILLTGLFFSVGFGQENFKSLYGQLDNAVVAMAPNSSEEECSQEVPSNSLENGGLFGEQRLAVDIDVEAGSTFTISQIIPTLIGESTFINVIIHEDNFGLPGADLITIEDIPVTEAFPTGTNFGFTFYQTTLEPETPIVLEGGESGTKYWLEIYSDAGGWESTSVESLGELGAFNNASTQGEWSVGDTEYVYLVVGDCSTMGVSDVNAAELSIYPNPAKDVVNVSLKNADVQSISVTNLSGQTVATSKNTTVSVSALPAGVYVVRVVDTKGAVHTSKVVVK